MTQPKSQFFIHTGTLNRKPNREKTYIVWGLIASGYFGFQALVQGTPKVSPMAGLMLVLTNTILRDIN